MLSMLLLVSLASAGRADTTIDKQPDVGPYWHPVGNGGTHVYADSFICPPGDTGVVRLGTWLMPQGGEPYSVISLQVWGGGDAGPDCNRVLAKTDDFTAPDPGLNLHLRDAVASEDLVPGQRYWFVITGAHRGDPNNSPYQTGGHTQNSRYPDNGEFWYANDENGCSFDGQRNTPEMAFQVYLGGNTCQYTVTKSKAKGGCQACPQRGGNLPTEAECENVGDCRKKIKTTLSCPQGPGTCKVKGKRDSCG